MVLSHSQNLADAFLAHRHSLLGRDLVAQVRAESRLFDACLKAGMPFDEPVVEVWAAQTLLPEAAQ